MKLQWVQNSPTTMLFVSKVKRYACDSRKNLLVAVEQWGKVVQISNHSSSSCNTCTSYLNLRDSSAKMQSSYSKSKMEEFASTALKLASTSKALEYVKEAMNRGVEYAIGTNRNYDATKAKFFASIGGGSNKSFYTDLYYCMEYKQHSSSYKGGCGYTIGSKYYIEYYEKKVLKKESISVWSNYGYYEYVKNRVKKIGEHITEIATKYKKDETVYIIAENKTHLNTAIKSLNKYDASIHSSIEDIINSKPNKIKSMNEELLFYWKSKLGNVTKPSSGVRGYGVSFEGGLGIHLSVATYYVIDSYGNQGIAIFTGIGGGFGVGFSGEYTEWSDKDTIFDLTSKGLHDYDFDIEISIGALSFDDEMAQDIVDDLSGKNDKTATEYAKDTAGNAVEYFSGEAGEGVLKAVTNIEVDKTFDVISVPKIKTKVGLTMSAELVYGKLLASWEVE